PHLAAADPALELLKLPDVDTLRLSPLAFPRNPYHHLAMRNRSARASRSCVFPTDLDTAFIS
ncbi:MAG: hypothetical protein RLO46_02975, partial [Pseudomonadales bacterium]